MKARFLRRAGVTAAAAVLAVVAAGVVGVSPAAAHGCTPGFFKTDKAEAFVLANLGLNVNTATVGSIFTSAPAPIAGMTLAQGLELGGGGLNALTRHAIAAYLNARLDAVGIGDWGGYSVATIVAIVNDAYLHPAGAEEIKDDLAALNELGCSINIPNR